VRGVEGFIRCDAGEEGSCFCYSLYSSASNSLPDVPAIHELQANNDHLHPSHGHSIKRKKEAEKEDLEVKQK
jgi:hypothetical protein